ncbi:protein CsuE [Sphingomonas sp. PAMC26645]|uniref:protein CsuE n=1 Tax=Sphingomonas sp. PAMC26645 TaxID=2565555 RepID=UPI00109E2A29|nr:protein CsuE [Sphingomonas sp. PAMC26645]QCB41104.1 protein CsuE [Sphingomonas sp. PAMC26645]
MDLGTFSPAALFSTDKLPSAMPYVAMTGSFGCNSTPLLALMSGDSLVVTVKSGTVYTLKSPAGATATYLLAADSGGQNQLVAGTPRTIINGTTSLLTNTRAAVPLYLKARSTTPLAPGVYTGSFEVKWDWSFCTLLGAKVLGLDVCVLSDTGSASGIVSMRMTVAEMGAIVSISQRTTWEASASTNNPKAIPGSKLRMIVKIANPDIVPLDTLTVTLPTPAGLRVALDGDGAGSGAVVQAGDTTGTTGLKFNYASPSDTGDDVDFASGNNVWGYKPVAGDLVTQGLVTAVQFNPKGPMAAGTAYTISIPYSVK